MLDALCLTRRIGPRAVVDHVSFALPEGRLTALLGPNGAGKTTLLRLLSGQLQPSEGQIRLDGKDITHWSGTALAAKRAFMAQSVHLPFAFTAEAVVALGLGALESALTHVQRRAIVAEAMERAQVTSFAGRPVPTLSGGEQQRVHFARVLAQLLAGRRRETRQVLFLDEPVSSLDPLHQISLMREVRALTREGLTVVAVLHDLNLSIACADHLIALKEGQLAGQGSPAEFITPERLASLFGLKADVLHTDTLVHPVVVPHLDTDRNSVWRAG